MTLREIIRSITGAPPAPLPPPVETVDEGPMSPLTAELLSADDFAALAELAQSGNGDAQHKLGMIYYRGLGVEIDRAEAFKWLTLAADQGDLAAMETQGLVAQGMDSGTLHEARCRVARFRGEPEPEPAQPLIEPEIPRDNVFTADATLTAESLVSESSSVESSVEAAAPAETAAKPVVFINPTSAIGQGAGASVNPAFWWWVWGVIGVVGILVAVGLWFRPARNSAQVAFEPTPTPFNTVGVPGAASQPSSDATLLMAGFNDLVVMANRGNVRAQYLVGLALAKGDGVEMNLAQAAEWYRKAAVAGDRDAQNNLGVFHIEGTGVERDAAEAYKWFSLAADGGSRGAAKNREQLALMLSGEQIAEGSRRAAAFAIQSAGSKK